MTSCNLKDIQNYTKEKTSSIGQDYSFVTFTDVESYDLVDNKKCYNKNRLAMEPLSNDLYTPEACKSNAGKKQNTYNVYNNRELSKPIASGLNFKVVDGYYNDDLWHFERYDVKVLQTGITTNLSSVEAGTNNTRIPTHNFSVKWSGYFVPDQTGMWVFETTSDDASMVILNSAESQVNIHAISATKVKINRVLNNKR